MTASVKAVSIIVPVLNEAEGIAAWYRDNAAVLNSKDVELIVVDGGSSDATVTLLRNLGAENLRIEQSEPGRARQMNRGAKLASGKCLLFLHADTRLPADALGLFNTLESSSERAEVLWGRFDVRFDNPAWPFRMIAWFINWRSALSGIATGDQAIFVHRQAFDAIGGFPDQALMEDVEFSARMRRQARPIRFKSPVLTAARKWEREGIWKTILLMWRLRLAYALGTSPDKLAERYYPPESPRQKT